MSAVETDGVLVVIHHHLCARRLLRVLAIIYVINELILGGLCKSILIYMGTGFVGKGERPEGNP